MNKEYVRTETDVVTVTRTKKVSILEEDLKAVPREFAKSPLTIEQLASWVWGKIKRVIKKGESSNGSSD